MKTFEEGYVYRLASKEEWEAAQSGGTLPWNADDERDGFFHLSGPDQVQETARRHYGEALGLLALALREADLGKDLKWEASHGGERFPHYYGEVKADRVAGVLRLTRGMGNNFLVVGDLAK
ncbi:DUF952 domain-containing protein [Parvularcula oceani]|uniref:DUF952 domain-containing protein n=1 Tax=Parvularcula oceani TaxID=1247963 RepID=UPI00068B65B7|nr:DUF952 domain-containing protein [Parvularcula oceani]